MRFVASYMLGFVAVGAAQASAQSLDWLATVGSGGNDAGNAIVADSQRNVIAAGQVINSASLMPGGQITWFQSGTASYVYKLSEQREFVWFARIENASGGATLAIDHQDNLLLGSAAQSAFTNIVPAIGASDTIFTNGSHPPALLWKLGPAGDTQWLRSFSTSATASVNAITTRGDNSIVAAGRFQGTIELGATPGAHTLTSAGNADVFVVALDAGGNFLWCRRLGGSADERVNAIAATADDEVVLGGSFGDTLTIDDPQTPTQLVSEGGVDGFVVRLHADGSVRWAGSIGGSTDDLVRSVAIDTGGNLAIAGSFSGSADLDPGAGTLTASSTGSDDAFVSLLDADGDAIWARGFGGSGSDTAGAVAFGSGKIYVGGIYSGSVDFNPDNGGHVVSSLGVDDGYVLRLDRDGAFDGLVTFGGDSLVAGGDRVQGFALDTRGALLVTGGYAEATDFDPSPDTTYIVSNDSSFSDGFVWKLEDAGALTVQATISAPKLTFGNVARVELAFASTLGIDLGHLGIAQMLPAQLRIAADAATTSDCGGTVTAIPGAAQFMLADAGLAAGATCSISVGVVAAAVGNANVETQPAAVSNDEQVWPLTSSVASTSVAPSPSTLQLLQHEPNPSMPDQTVTFGVGVMPASADVAAASGHIVVGDGVDSCTIDLPANSCSIAFAGLGTHALSISYTGDANYLPTTITANHEVSAFSDIGIAIESVPSSWQGGSDIDFDLRVSNAGPNDASGVIVSAPLPQLTRIAWACSSGCDASGDGDVATPIDVPSGGNAVIHVRAHVPPLPENPITVTASASVAASTIDDNADNNSASYTATVVLFRNGFD